MSLPTPTPRIKTPPSPHFDHVLFEHAEGKTSAVCDLCERVHYQGSHRPMAASYDEEAEKNPDGYVKHEGPVKYTWLNGQQVVQGCPCNKLAAFEEFIWDNRRLIASYFDTRAAATTAAAVEESTFAARIGKATN